MKLDHLVRPTSWKCWPIRLNCNGLLSFCSDKSRVNIFDLKSGSMYTRKYSVLNWAWLGTTWPVISLSPFLKEILIQTGCFRPSLIRLSGVPSASKDVQWVYQLNWGVFCALIRSIMDTIFTCFGLDYTWVLIAYLLDCAGISTSANDYYKNKALVDERIGHWNVNEKTRWRNWLCRFKVMK